MAARNLLLEGGPWSSRWAGSEGGEKGGYGCGGTELLQHCRRAPTVRRDSDEARHQAGAILGTLLKWGTVMGWLGVRDDLGA
jgi:hypothetical protein